jgi:hypothetical protein
MNVLKWIKDQFGPKDPASKAERLYQKGLRLTREHRFQQAIPILEEAAMLNPVSASIHQVLGFSYSQVAGEYEGDEAAMNSWVNKAADTFWKAITLHREHGGLEQKQVTTAMEMVAAVDRINIGKSNTPPEDQRKTIFREYKSARESGFDFYAAAGDIIRGSSLTDMFGSLQRHSGGAEDKAIAHAMKKFGVTERQLRAMIQEGENKNW